MSKFLTISDCLKKSLLLDAISDSARLDVELLVALAIDKTRAFLYTWPETILSEKELNAFELFFERRQKGEPIAYILGEKEFWSRSFLVSPSTLIPRDDTECLVDHGIRVARLTTTNLEPKLKPLKILDLGTGTGAIGITLALELPEYHVEAVELSVDAVALAQKNATRLHANNISIFQSDWFSNVSGAYQIIVSNPPYIDRDDHHLNEGDVRFEPNSALVADKCGLADIKAIAQSAQRYLTDGGYVLVEHGYDQGQAVNAIFNEAGYCDVITEQDLSGNDRFCVARMQMKNMTPFL